MRIRIALLLAMALVGLVAGLALAALSRSPATTLVAPIEVGGAGDSDRPDRIGKKDRDRKDDRDDDGADPVSGPTAVPAGDDDDDDDDNSGPGSDDDDDDDGPGGDDDDGPDDD
jgi:phosphopantothenoylcysteine synthetase/decarboxylase